MGMEFKGLDGRAADPLLVTIVANIIFNVRYAGPLGPVGHANSSLVRVFQLVLPGRLRECSSA